MTPETGSLSLLIPIDTVTGRAPGLAAERNRPEMLRHRAQGRDREKQQGADNDYRAD